MKEKTRVVASVIWVLSAAHPSTSSSSTVSIQNIVEVVAILAAALIVSLYFVRAWKKRTSKASDDYND